MNDPIAWLTGFSALAFAWQLSRLFRALQSRSWPATAALIRSVSIAERDQGDGDMAYSAHVEFSYRVGGKNDVSNRLAFSASAQLSHDQASGLISGLSPGFETKAFYDPSQPGIAVLRKGVDRPSLVKTAVLGALTAACLIVSFRASA